HFEGAPTGRFRYLSLSKAAFLGVTRRAVPLPEPVEGSISRGYPPGGSAA
ncbi:MAG: hypothetical protein GYA15_15630, partial [Leptolinea sp.]|nr:hypothetical protein [Leptolinea sp.]